MGSMGRHHARILLTMPEAELAAVADADAGAFERAGVAHLPSYRTVEELLDAQRLDGVVVAVPTYLHAPAAAAVLRRGVAVLVEKPIARTVEEAEELNRLADERGALLAVGHVERFNPAVQELKRRLDAGDLGRLFHIDVRRTGPFPQRIGDVGVTVDLATHDLDVLSYLLDAEPDLLFARVAKRLHVDHEDLLTATLQYPAGVLATLQTNWLAPVKTRQLSVTGEGGVLSVDYLSQELRWYENGEMAEGWDSLATLRGVSEGRLIGYPIRRREPLAVELEGFVSALSGRGGKVVP